MLSFCAFVKRCPQQYCCSLKVKTFGPQNFGLAAPLPSRFFGYRISIQEDGNKAVQIIQCMLVAQH